MVGTKPMERSSAASLRAADCILAARVMISIIESESTIRHPKRWLAVELVELLRKEDIACIIIIGLLFHAQAAALFLRDIV